MTEILVRGAKPLPPEAETLLAFGHSTKAANLPAFYVPSSYCFQRILAITILSVCPSVRPSVTWVNQSKMVQARITKFLLLAAWKTLVSGTAKLFHKFEGAHPERGR